MKRSEFYFKICAKLSTEIGNHERHCVQKVKESPLHALAGGVPHTWVTVFEFWSDETSLVRG